MDDDCTAGGVVVDDTVELADCSGVEVGAVLDVTSGVEVAGGGIGAVDEAGSVLEGVLEGTGGRLIGIEEVVTSGDVELDEGDEDATTGVDDGRGEDSVVVASDGMVDVEEMDELAV